MAELAPDVTQAVEEAFTAWLPDPDLGRVRQNIASETALGIDLFARLLNSFATQLARGEIAVTAWRTACRAHKLHGRQIPAADCPAVVGRARGLDDHATSVARSSRGVLTSSEAKRLLLKHASSVDLAGFDAFLRSAPLGNYLVWATFDAADPDADPFVRLPPSLAGICTALGLKNFTTRDALIVLVWNHVDSGSPPLHRPTVADAEDYPHYRPHPEADAAWGLTDPLPPNPDELQPQPEVVMPEMASNGLQLPFRVVQA